jgi:predicted amidohydrolase
MRRLTLAATQMSCTWHRDRNVDRAIDLVREAASRGAQVVLPQELFETPYFCKEQRQDLFALAAPVADHPVLARMSALAAELGVVLPVSFFERANNAFFNSLAMIDAARRAAHATRVQRDARASASTHARPRTWSTTRAGMCAAGLYPSGNSISSSVR